MRSLALAALLSVPAAAAPALRPERVVLHTDAGDLVLALYAGAPKHAAKLLALFRDGAYDGVPAIKVDPTRFIAFGGVERRRAALPSARLRAINRLPVETGGGPHRAGVVAMAHEPGDPDASETAFVILFADIAAMDGRFSAVGEAAGDRGVLEALKALPVDGASRPVERIEIRGASVFALEADLARTALRGPDRAAAGRDGLAKRRRLLLSLGAFTFALGTGLWLGRNRFGPAWSSAGLLACLAGYFAAFAALADLSASSGWVSVPLFAATIGVFRLMSRFER